MYCTDADLLRWEPRLAAEASAVAQSVFDGLAAFDRQSLTLAPLNVACATAAGAIAAHDDGERFAIAGACGAAGMQSPREMRVAVRTFGAQRRVVSDLLSRVARTDARADDLRRAAVLGTLHLIYAALAAASAPGAEADAIVRRELYERLYRRALRAVIPAFETDDAGEDVPAAKGRPRLADAVGD